MGIVGGPVTIRATTPTDDAAVGGHRCPRSRQGLPAPGGMRRYAAVGQRASRTRPTTGTRCLRGERRGESHPSRRRVSTAVRLEFPILSGESAPPVWRQPNVDHVGSWRATAPRRPAAPSRHVCSVRCSTATRYPPNAQRLSAHDCPCWRVKPLLLSNGSPLAVGFPSNASSYQLARLRRT